MRKVTEDYIGTCQACFGEFKVGDDKLMVLHGYRRPGDGYTHGNCAGYNHKPFEYEHTLTDEIIAELHKQIAKDNEYLRALNAGEVVKLFRLEKQYDANHRAAGEKLIEYTPADKKWDSVLQGKIYGVERDIRWNEGLVTYFEMRVAGWKLLPIVGIDTPVTGRERGLAKAYNPIEAAAAEQRAKEKAARDAKPGKLKVIFYQPAYPRPAEGFKGHDAEWRNWYDAKERHEAAFTAHIKQWVKANIEGKAMIRQAVGDYDLPRTIRGTGSFDVVIAHLPWEYRDEIVKMILKERIADAMCCVDGPKEVTFAVPGKPN